MNVYNYPTQSFCKANTAELEAIKYFYGLQMDTSALLAVQKYFYTLELRDPTADELALLDSFYRFNKDKTSSVRIKAVRSEDKNVGDAFADIIKKLEAVEGNLRSSYSYKELLGASQKALNYFKSSEGCNLPIVHGTPHSLTDAMNDIQAENHVAVSCNGFNFTVSDSLASKTDKDKNARRFCDTDHFVLICKDSEIETSESLENIIFNFKKALGSTALIKKVLMTDESGIVGAVLNTSAGAFVNFSMLCSLPYSFSPRSLSAGLPEECAVALVSNSSVTNIINAAQGFGLKAIPFGRPTVAKRLTLTTGIGAPISITSDFIRSIATSKRTEADVLKAEANKDTEIKLEDHEVQVAGEKLVGAVTLNGGGFVDAAKALIYSVSKLVSCGIALENTVSSVSINAKNLSTGEILSYITGIYRVRAELSLASSNDCVRNIDTDSTLCALVAAKSNITSERSRKTAPESTDVYLLYPRAESDGLPKFSDLRRLFEYVSSLVKSNKAVSVRAVGTQGLKSCIDDMGYTEVNIPSDIENLAICGSFVLESAESIEGLKLFTKKQ